MAKSKVTNIKSKMKPDFNGFISKIRIDAKSDIPEISFKENRKNGTGKIEFEGREKPLDSFLSAMQALSVVFCEICELQKKQDDVLITTVNFSEKGGVVISGQVPLDNGVPQPLCVNTPHIMIESDKGYSLPEYAIPQLEELKKQAILYAQGETAEKQQDLFEGSEVV